MGSAGSTVLELGAGTGYVAMGLAMTSSSAVVKKVYAVESGAVDQAFDNLCHNVKVNHCEKQVVPVCWDWKATPAIPAEIPLEEVNLIIGSDLVFQRYYCEISLAHAIGLLLRDSR